MHCRICGTSKKVKYRRGPRMSLCPDCAAGTPKKATYEGFTKKYWADPGLVSESIKREFYNDYKTSKHTLQEYIDVTSSWIFED